MYNKIMSHEVVADLHTHTTFSGHAFSTISENIAAGGENGMSYIACTDHFIGDLGTTPHHRSQEWLNIQNERYRIMDMEKVVNTFKYGRPLVIQSAEFNLDTPVDKILMEQLTWRPIGLHNWFFQDPHRVNPAVLARLYFNAISDGFNAFVHIERCRGYFQNAEDCYYFLHELVDLAVEHDIWLEVNETSLRTSVLRHAITDWLVYAASKRAKIYLGSDAHIAHRVGKFPKALHLLNSLEYPRELILNLDIEAVQRLQRYIP